MKKILTLVLSFALCLTARAIDPVQEGQKVLNGNGVETYISAMLGTPIVGAGVFSPTQKLNWLGNIGQYTNNNAAVFQTITAATRTYLVGSDIHFAAGTLKVGGVLRWHFDMTKTAAGTAASTIDLAFGTTGTTSDTAQVSFTKPAGTAAIDEGFVDIEAIVQAIGASGVVMGEFRMVHNLAATGHATIPCVVVNNSSSAFITSTVTDVGVCITTGALDAITINQVSAEAFSL